MNKQSKFFLISAIGGVLLFFACGAIASSMKDSYEYIFDEDFRDMAKLLDAVKYVAIGSAIVDVIFALCYANQQDNQQTSPGTAYNNATAYANGRRITDAEKDAQNEQLLASGGWKCSCGRVQASYVSTCTCGKNKREVLRLQAEKEQEKEQRQEQEERRLIESKEQEVKTQEKNVDEIGKAAAIIEYKKLLDAGIISSEEFEAKKKQLLGL